jgi:hypothetical protein
MTSRNVPPAAPSVAHLQVRHSGAVFDETANEFKI